MGRRNGAYVIETLREYLEARERITLFCSCGHSQTISLEKLIERFGPDFELVKNRDWFLRQFSCNKCGSKPRQMTIASENVPKGW